MFSKYGKYGKKMLSLYYSLLIFMYLIVGTNCIMRITFAL